MKINLKAVFLLLVLFFGVAILPGCSRLSSGGSEHGLAIQVNSSSRVRLDEQIDARSRALHAFLKGQLAMSQQQIDDALQFFAISSALVEEPAPTLHEELAHLYTRKGELEKALKEAEKASGEDQKSVDLQLLHAGLLDCLGLLSDSQKAYLQLGEQAPELLTPFIYAASISLRNGNNDEAIKILRPAVKRLKSDFGYFYLSRAYERIGRLKEAEYYARLAYEKSKMNEDYAVAYLRVLVKRGRKSASYALAEDLLQITPENNLVRQTVALKRSKSEGFSRLKEILNAMPIEESQSDTRYLISLYHIENRDFPQAIRELSLLLALTPDFSKARYYLASIYAGSGRKKEAVTELERIPPGDPMFIKSRTFGSFILKQDGEFDLAEKMIRQAYEQDPDNRNILFFLISILRESQRFAEAKEVIAERLKMEGSNSRLWFNYAIVLHDLGQDDEAFIAMEKVIELDPMNGDALNYVAYALAEETDELDRAEELIQRALQVQPNDGYYLDTLGWIHVRRGEYEKAEEYLQRAVAIVPDDIVILEHYGDVLVKRGKEIKGMKTYILALERVDPDTLSPEEENAVDRLEDKLSSLFDRYPEYKAELAPF